MCICIRIYVYIYIYIYIERERERVRLKQIEKCGIQGSCYHIPKAIFFQGDYKNVFQQLRRPAKFDSFYGQPPNSGCYCRPSEPKAKTLKPEP